MKIIYLLIVCSFVYSECDDYTQIQCDNNVNCDWVEDIELENCNFAWSESNCQAHDGCEWECEMVWDSSLWEDVLVCDCYGQYQVDVGYCEEVEMPECSEMSQSECSSNGSCDWVEDIEIGNCSDITNGSECYQTNQCSWYNAGNYGYWYDNCYGGTYEIDNSYCEESSAPEYQLGDVNQDSIINIQDVIIIVNLVLNNNYNYLADMNDDHRIDILDIIELVNRILN